MKPFNFYLPTKIIFGHKRIKELAFLLPTKISRILIVTDKNIANNTPILENVRLHLDKYQIFYFQDVKENPDFANVEDGARIAREIEAEFIIGVGGGSSMDAAKGIALLAVNDLSLRDYVKGKPVLNSPLPVICIPTTAGSGSEVTPYTVFTDVENWNKIGYVNPELFPVVSIVDPELTYSMPETIAINTGLDALTHALESYLSTESSVINDNLAVKIIEAVLKNIHAASKKNQTAMDTMAYNAMLAGIAIAHSGTILPHIMGYCLTVYHKVPHGRASAALLPAVLDFLQDHSTAKNKVIRLGKMFVPYGGVRNFIEELGVPTRLSSYGVHGEELDNYARKVITKNDIRITPATITIRDVLHIYQSAL